jgi:hypothetical protein
MAKAVGAHGRAVGDGATLHHIKKAPRDGGAFSVAERITA